MKTSAVPLSLYIHFPWCLKKCPYCDFNSHEPGSGTDQESVYLGALLRDLGYEQYRTAGRRIRSIFIGGGTPSLLTGDAVGNLLEWLAGEYPLVENCEITMEANPGAADAARFKAYRAAGVNRLSIGVQSFSDDRLYALGRIHNAADADLAIRAAGDSGFSDVNLDLMYGLPGQDVAGALADLETAVTHQPSHISWYQLTLEPNTRFYSHPPDLPDEDTVCAIQERGAELLQEAGYERYEISAWARQGRYCVHNMNYWQFGDYIGVGAGAHGKYTGGCGGGISRFSRHRIPQRYMELAGSDGAVTGRMTLGRNDLCLEFMMNALRLTGGFQLSLFTERTGLPAAVLDSGLQQAVSQGLIDRRGQVVRPTPAGLNFLNDLTGLFIMD